MKNSSDGCRSSLVGVSGRAALVSLMCLLAASSCGPNGSGDAGTDSGPADTGTGDSGPGDSGPHDSGPDAGPRDGSVDIDSGPSDAHVDPDGGHCGGKTCQANATLNDSCECVCDDGYTANSDNTMCTSPCTGACDTNATCSLDSQNQASCTCIAGYYGSGVVGDCTRNACYRPGVDGGPSNNEGDCPAGANGADNHASCENIGPRGTCVCDQGYVAQTTDGGTLVACLADECSPSPCDPQATCQVTPTGHTCTCTPPLVGSGNPGGCSIVNHCGDTTAYCDRNANCAYDAATGSSCTCHNDFSGTGRPGDCHLNNYCVIDPTYCDDNAVCTFHDLDTPMPGTFCKCKPGYDGHGSPGDCVLHDLCTDTPSRCDAVATCHFTPGVGDGFNCSCPDGMAGDGTPGHCHPGYTDMSSGWFGSCAIRGDKQLYCWGDASQGAIGIGQLDPNRSAGDADNITCPTQVGVATDWLKVVAGQEHACGIRAAGSSTTQGTLWCWGVNGVAQLGYDTFTGQSEGRLIYNSGTPKPVGTDSDWINVYAGWHNTCAMKADHSLWCWGYDYFGAVVNGVASSASWLNGNLNTPSVLAPAKVTIASVSGSDTGWIEVAIGNDHMCGLRDDGSLWCWGKNTAGQLGDGSNTQRDVPVQISAGSGVHWLSVTAGGDHSLAIKSDGSLWCWGDNAFSSCGRGVTEGQMPQANNAPLEVFEIQSNPLPWFTVSAGPQGNHVCGTRQDGSVWCWGSNALGEAAQPLGGLGYITVPLPARGLPTGVLFDSVHAGSSYTCGLDTKHRIWCWGQNVYGQLGQCLTDDSNATPSQTK
jgi:alpha-tubulin suppressor-like RCC1 family protein